MNKLKNIKKETTPSKKAMNAFMKFIEVCEGSKVVLKTSKFYEKQTFSYYKRLTTAVRNLQKHSTFLSPAHIKKIKTDTRKLLKVEMDRMKKIHAEAIKEIDKI